MSWRQIVKWFLQDGWQADFAEYLRAAPFNEGLYVNTALNKIYLAWQYLQIRF